MEPPFPPEMKVYRDFISRQFLRGAGIEIGAGHMPVAISENTSVKYVDYKTLKDLQDAYGVSDAWKDPDVVDDGQKLERFASESLDFIVANHVLEHTEDPIGVVLNWFSKLRNDGLVYVAIPDKRFSFDVDRPLTNLNHFVVDYNEGPQASRFEHFREFARLVNRAQEEDVDRVAKELIATDYRIHFHTWDQNTFLDFLSLIKMRYRHFSLEHYGRNTNEILAVMRVVVK